MTDPLLKALIEKLPEAGSEWPVQRQALWLRCMSGAMAMVYDRGHDGDSLLIEAIEQTRELRVVRTVPVGRASVRYGDETVRVVIVMDRAGDQIAYVAQGLERDIAAQGPSAGEAMRRLRVTAEADNSMRVESGIAVDAAPQHVFDWYDLAPADWP